MASPDEASWQLHLPLPAYASYLTNKESNIEKNNILRLGQHHGHMPRTNSETIKEKWHPETQATSSSSADYKWTNN